MYPRNGHAVGDGRYRALIPEAADPGEVARRVRVACDEVVDRVRLVLAQQHRRLYSYGLYSYGLYRYSLHSYERCRYGLCRLVLAQQHRRLLVFKLICSNNAYVSQS